MNWQPDPDAWRKAFAETGYVVVENAVDPDTLARLRGGLEAIEKSIVDQTINPYFRRHVITESDRTSWLRAGKTESDAISVIMELPLFEPYFANLIMYPRILDLLEAIFESSEFAFHNYKAIYKMPGGNAPFQWHRDLPYLQHTSPNLLTCMLCIDPMTRENGATVVCPGTHRISSEDYKQGDTDMPESDVPDNRVSVECPAGSAVLFHVNIIHGGGPNRSQAPRRNVIGIWAGPECYPILGPRHAYEGIMPRSANPERQKQIAMALGKE